MAHLKLKLDMSNLSEDFLEHIAKLVRSQLGEFNLNKLSKDVEQAFLQRAPYLLACASTCEFLQMLGHTCQCARAPIRAILTTLCQNEGYERTSANCEEYQSINHFATEIMGEPVD